MHFVWGGKVNPELNIALANWAAQHIDGLNEFQSPFVTLGIFDEEQPEEPLGAVVYNNWHPDAGVIEMHASSSSKRWLSKASLKQMFQYPFNQLGCQMVVLRVGEENTGLHSILNRYGFKPHFIPRLRGRDKGEYIFTLTDDDWRENGYHKDYD